MPYANPTAKTTPKQRLNVVAIIVVGCNLYPLFLSSRLAYMFLFRVIGQPWDFYLTGGLTSLTAMGTLLASLTVILRQRTLAVYFQWLAVLALLTSALVTLWDALDHHVGPDSLLIVTGIPLLITLLLAWSAWFLKRMDDNK